MIESGAELVPPCSETLVDKEGSGEVGQACVNASLLWLADEQNETRQSESDGRRRGCTVGHASE